MGTEGTGKLLLEGVGRRAYARLMAGDLDPEGDRGALAEVAAAALAGARPGVAAFAAWYLGRLDPRLLTVTEPGNRCGEETGPGYWQRHTARVLAAADFLACGWGLTWDQHDALCVAALFHDTAKYDGDDGRWAGPRNRDHARLGAAALRAAVAAWEAGHGPLEPEAATVLADAARAAGDHMSCWCPEPQAVASMGTLSALLSTCDIFASQAHDMWARPEPE